MKRVLVEAGTVLIAGLIIALAANRLSPRGLQLGRDYFPNTIKTAATNSAAAHSTTSVSATNAVPSATNSVIARLRQKGLQSIELTQVEQLARAPQFAQEQTIFVDARDDQHYQAGHIPGAYQLDHYRLENHLPAVLPACLAAQRIVVYCTGGDCEDSEFAAVTLNQAGVGLDKLSVYPGGFTEWSSNSLPVEIGARKSGNLRQAKP